MRYPGGAVRGGLFPASEEGGRKGGRKCASHECDSCLPPSLLPSIRLTVSLELSDEELERAAKVIKTAASKHIT